MGTIRMTVKAIDWTQGDVGHVAVALRDGTCRIDWEMAEHLPSDHEQMMNL